MVDSLSGSAQPIQIDLNSIRCDGNSVSIYYSEDKCYYPDSLIYWKGFSDGKPNKVEGRIGTEEYYYPNGQLWQRTHYYGDIEVGMHQSFYPNGNIWFHGRFSDLKVIPTRRTNDSIIEMKQKWKAHSDTIRLGFTNTLDGEWIFYFESGKVQLKSKYSDDVRIGRWREYDESGRLIKLIYYQSDTIVEITQY